MRDTKRAGNVGRKKGYIVESCMFFFSSSSSLLISTVNNIKLVKELAAAMTVYLLMPIVYRPNPVH